MGISVDCGSQIQRVSAKMAGEVSIAMVCVVSAAFTSTKFISKVCKNDNACVGFPLAGGISSLNGDDTEVANMTCYKGGETVFNNHQMCDVTSESIAQHIVAALMAATDRKIIDMLPGRPPQVTFSCDSRDHTCAFQFWTAQVESFYCALEQCSSESQPGYDTNSTVYACEKIKCSCVPGRFICGENGSVGEWWYYVRGPANADFPVRYWGLFERRNQGPSDL